MENSRPEKVILYISGGTMKGVFGAGVVSTLEAHNAYPFISHIYASSAGIPIAAYFLTKQTARGSSIYLVDLLQTFISPYRFFLGIYDRLVSRYLYSIPKQTWHNAIDLPYLFSLFEEKKLLDAETLAKSAIPLYAILYNLNRHTIAYMDARKNIFPIIRAGVSVLPYTTYRETIQGCDYTDAGIIHNLPYHALRRRHPNEKIIFVLNGHQKRDWRYILKNKIEAFFISITEPDMPADLFLNAEKNIREEMRAIEADPRALLVSLSEETPMRSRTTSRNMLERAHEEGKKAGEKIRAFIREA